MYEINSTISFTAVFYLLEKSPKRRDLIILNDHIIPSPLNKQETRRPTSLKYKNLKQGELNYTQQFALMKNKTKNHLQRPFLQ